MAGGAGVAITGRRTELLNTAPLFHPY